MLPPWFGFLYFVIVSVFVWIPYLSLIILSFNRNARGFILKSSEFWIKVIYAAARNIVQVIRFIKVDAARSENNVTFYLGCTAHTVLVVTEIEFMTFVGGMDAIPQMKYKSKAILMGVCALWYSIEAIQSQLFADKDLDYVIYIQTANSEVSLQSLQANFTGMIAIFLWKQAIDVIRNKGRCISITYRPYLRWVRQGQDLALNGEEQNPDAARIADTDDTSVSTSGFGNNDFSFVGL